MPMDSPSFDFKKLSYLWTEQLKVFFRTLIENGDTKFFHPHPFTDEVAETLAHSGGNDLYYVVVEGKKVVGYGMLRGWDEGFEVPTLGIALHPSVRGKGLGHAFVVFLHDVARGKGARKILLKVYPEHSRAIKLYTSLGYKFISQDKDQLVGELEL